MSVLSPQKLIDKGRAAAMEVMSLPALLERPRYMGGYYCATRTHWSRAENVALKALAEAAADLEKSARGLGRAPSTIVHRARDTGLKLPPEWADEIRKTKRSKAAPRRLPSSAMNRGGLDSTLTTNRLSIGLRPRSVMLCASFTSFVF